MRISDIIWPESINQSSYTGWIFIRPEFNYFIYACAALILLASALVFRGKYPQKECIKKAVVVSFCSMAIVYAGAFEFIWSRWLSADMSAFGGKNGEAKQVALNGDYYNFISQCKKIIGTDNYTLFPDDTKSGTDTQLKFTRMQYYLLPSRNLPDSKYLIVWSGGKVLMDEASGTLYVGDTQFKNVTLCYRFDAESYVFRVTN